MSVDLPRRRKIIESLQKMESQCATMKTHLQAAHDSAQKLRPATPALQSFDTTNWEERLLGNADVDSLKVQSAALYIRDAMDGAHRIHPREAPMYRTAYLYHLKVISWLPVWSVLPLILHFFERPLWCKRWMVDPNKKARIQEPCQDSRYPSYPVDYLEVHWNLAIELLLFVPLAAHSLLLRFAHGPNFWKRWLNTTRAFVCIAYVVDMIYAYNTPQSDFSFAPYLRIGFVVLYSTPTRKRLRLVMRTLPEVLSIFVVIIGVLTFASWIAILLFPNQEDTKDGETEGETEGKAYFKNLYAGMWSLYILMTTANFPDVMMPAYKKNRWAFIPFVIFIVFSCFFLMNVLTAVVFNEFGEQRRESAQEKKDNYAHSFRRAFDILSMQKGFVSKDSILAVFREFNYYEDIEYIEVDDAEKRFQLLDKSHSNDLTWEEFLQLGNALAQNIVKEKPAQPPYLQTRFPSLKDNTHWQRFRAFLLGGTFDRCVDIVLLLNAVLLVVQTWGSIQGNDKEEEDEDMQQNFKSIELVITFFYFIEALLKILVSGWTNYISMPKNLFDFMVTACTTGTAIYVLIPNEFNNLMLVRYISMLRLLRILRLLNRLGPFRLVTGTFIVMLPQAVGLCKVLGVVLYFFAVVGCNLFGEVINTDSESEYGQRLKDTDFADAGYWANNFNDMFSGIAVLFELLVVNNWFVLAGGFEKACNGVWVYAYFVVFHVIAVCCCLNIVVAFIIDAFLEEYDKKSNEGGERLDPVATLHSEVIDKMKCQLTDDHEVASRDVAKLKHFKSFLKALESDDLGKEPRVQDVVKVFKGAIPYAFEDSVRTQPGIAEGLSVVASFAEVLVRNALAEAENGKVAMGMKDEINED